MLNPFLFVLLMTVMNHVAFKGSKVLISLFAIELGAQPLLIGVLVALYSLFSVFLSVYAGRISDRLGPRLPMLFGSIGLAAALAMPYLVPRVPGLVVSALMIGTCYIFYTVAMQHLIGALGEGAERTRNYSIFSIFVGVTSLVGPTMTGFAIDGIGHRATYLLLAALPVVPVLVLVFLPGLMPAHKSHPTQAAQPRVGDLLKNAPLRRVLLTAGILETGNEVLNFLLPIYGHSIGLSASRIGLVMGTYALALLLVRTVMPALARRSSEERVLSVSMLVAALACLAYPFVTTFALLAATSFVLGLGLGCGGPISMALAYNRSPRGRSGEAIGLRQTVNKFAEVVVPLLFGVATTLVGMWPVFWFDAAMLAFGASLMASDAARSGTVASEPMD
jgi:MFS family permease